jgi:hypothetical protein
VLEVHPEVWRGCRFYCVNLGCPVFRNVADLARDQCGLHRRVMWHFMPEVWRHLLRVCWLVLQTRSLATSAPRLSAADRHLQRIAALSDEAIRGQFKPRWFRFQALSCRLVEWDVQHAELDFSQVTLATKTSPTR